MSKKRHPRRDCYQAAPGRCADRAGDTGLNRGHRGRCETSYWMARSSTPFGRRDHHRELATLRQQSAPACVSGLPTAGSGGVCARLRGLAGCATPTGSAGQAHRSAQTNPELTFNPDHPMGADQPRNPGAVNSGSEGAPVTGGPSGRGLYQPALSVMHWPSRGGRWA